jgi:hypothetical protein
MSNNYRIAWNMLVESCRNTCLIATNHIQELLELKQLPKESASHSAELVNAVWNNVNALEALNIYFKTHHMQSVSTQAKLLSSPSPKGFNFSPRREEMSPRKC